MGDERISLTALLALVVIPFLLPPSSVVVSSCFPSRPIGLDHWRGEYFKNRELAGAPAMIRDDGAGELDFDWGLDGPSKECEIGVDDFSARWTRTVPFGAGAYRFTITADDGVRLLIDGRERFASWREHAMATHTVDVALTAGNHRITLEYFERLGSAAVRLRWAAHPCMASVAPDRWRAGFTSAVNSRSDSNSSVFP